jgi:O-succinylbenzoate synthase
MNIERIEIYHMRMRLNSPFRTSVGVEHDRDCLILCLHSEGLKGWGECVAGQFPGYSYETVGTAWHVLTEFLVPILLKNDTWDVPAFVQSTREIRGHPLARAGLEMALWDLSAKRKGVSLSKFLGGIKSKVPVGVSIGIQPDIATLLEVVNGYVDLGYMRVKLKIEPGNDLESVSAVRLEHPDLPLQVDANTAYRIDDAATLKAMDEFDLAMIEQPFAEDDLLDHSKLQARIRTPICLDESILGLRHIRQAIELDACRVLNVKQARVGGIQEALAIHEFCAGNEIPLWCGGMLETGIGRAANLALASLPGFTLPGDISATDRYYIEDIAEPRFELNPDSTIDVPCEEGLGVTIDKQALARFTLRTESFK